MTTGEGNKGKFRCRRQHPGHVVCSLNVTSWLRLRISCATIVLLVLLALPAGLQAQYTYTTNNGTITIKQYTGPGGAVIIPSTITGLPVTSIGNLAFVGRPFLTSVTIPSSVSSIGLAAFASCTNLARVTISDGVTSIGAAAFDNCWGLASVTIPGSVANIGENAFSWCTNLISVTIGNSVTNIGNYAFWNCFNLAEVLFQGNAPGVGSSAFLGDYNATVFYLPGTSGWGSTFGGVPTSLWMLPNPLILDFGPDFGVQTNGFGFIISWADNLPVVVEACTDLANSNWSPVATNTLTGGTSYFSDPDWANYPARFYRLRSP